MTGNYNITRPPGYKLYTHLFHSALRKLNDKIIKYKLLKIYISDLKNCVKFDKYDYSQLDYEFYFGVKEKDRFTSTGQLTVKARNIWVYLEENLKNNPYLIVLQKILDNLLFYSKQYYNNKFPILYNIDPNKSLGASTIFGTLSTNKYLSKEFIKKNINNNWIWNSLIQNDIIELDFIENFVPNFWEKRLSHSNARFCKKFIVTMDFIEKYIDKPWNWTELSYNQNITSEFIEKHIDKPWDKLNINIKNGIDLNFIEKHIDKPWWNFEELSLFVEKKIPTREETLRKLNTKLSGHPYYYRFTGGYFTIPKEFVFKYFDKDWDLSELLADDDPDSPSELLAYITVDILDKYPLKLSNYAYDIMKKKIGFCEKFMEKYVPKPWDWRRMLYYPDIPKIFRIKYFDEFFPYVIERDYLGEVRKKNFLYDFTDNELDRYYMMVNSKIIK